MTPETYQWLESQIIYIRTTATGIEAIIDLDKPLRHTIVKRLRAEQHIVNVSKREDCYKLFIR